MNIQDGAGANPNDSRLYEPDGSEERHNLCGTEPWLNGVHPTKGFHPTLDGHRNTGQLAASAIDGLTWPAENGDSTCSIASAMAAHRAKGLVPIRLRLVGCDGDWAIALVLVVGTDGGDSWDLLHRSGGEWRHLFQIASDCHSRATQAGMPNELAARWFPLPDDCEGVRSLTGNLGLPASRLDVSDEPMTFLSQFAATWTVGATDKLDWFADVPALSGLPAAGNGSLTVDSIDPALCYQGSSGAGACRLVLTTGTDTRTFWASYVNAGERLRIVEMGP